MVSAMTVTEAGAEYTRYSMEVTPAHGDEAWTVHHRFSDFIALRKALTALAGPGSLPQCWADVSKARSVTGRHRCHPPSMVLFSTRPQALEGLPCLEAFSYICQLEGLVRKVHDEYPSAGNEHMHSFTGRTVLWQIHRRVLRELL